MFSLNMLSHVERGSIYPQHASHVDRGPINVARAVYGPPRPTVGVGCIFVKQSRVVSIESAGHHGALPYRALEGHPLDGRGGRRRCNGAASALAEVPGP